MEVINLLKEFSVQTESELLAAKTSQKQSRAVISGKPKRVQIALDQVKRLCTKAGIEYKAGYENRILEYTTTNETVDRYGDIVRAKGLDFKTNYYPNNPIMMFSHQYQMLPIGNAIKIWYDSESKSIPAWGLFMDDEVDKSGFSDLVFRIAQAGFMRACSIGFMPTEWNNPAKDEDRQALGLGKYGLEYLKGEYLEFSPCGIPANPQALCSFIEANKDISKLDIETIDKMERVKLFDDLNILQVLKDVSDKSYTVSLPSITINDTTPITFSIDMNDYETFCKEHDCCCIEELKEIKPYPNEHACRLQEPGKYSEFRRGSRKSDDKVYSVIFGKVKDAETWEEQAYRYAKDVWTEDEAKKHCEAHEGISFEAAAEKEEENIKELINELSEKILKEIAEVKSELYQMRTSASDDNSDDLYQELDLDLKPKL